MEWIKINEGDKLPEGEVLAINNTFDYLVGYVYMEANMICCESDDQMLYSVTHYAKLTRP